MPQFLNELKNRNSKIYQILVFSDNLQCLNGNNIKHHQGLRGMVTSPFYPKNYPPSQQCHNIISVPTGMIIFLRLHEFDLTESSGKHWSSCKDAFDYIEIRTGKTLSASSVARFCSGHKPPITQLFMATNIILSFISDSFSTSTGFNVSYFAVPLNCKFFRNICILLSRPSLLSILF